MIISLGRLYLFKRCDRKKLIKPLPALHLLHLGFLPLSTSNWASPPLPLRPSRPSCPAFVCSYAPRPAYASCSNEWHLSHVLYAALGISPHIPPVYPSNKAEYTLKVCGERKKAVRIPNNSRSGNPEWVAQSCRALVAAVVLGRNSAGSLPWTLTMDPLLFRPFLPIYLMTFLPLCVFSFGIIAVNIEHTLRSHLRYLVNSGEPVLRKCLPPSMYPTLRLVR